MSLSFNHGRQAAGGNVDPNKVAEGNAVGGAVPGLNATWWQ